MDYPEHKRLEALDGANDVVGEFLEWLQDQHVELTVHEGREIKNPCPGGDGVVWRQHNPAWSLPEDEERGDVADHSACQRCGGKGYITSMCLSYWPVHKSIEDWIAEFFGINRQKLAEEKEQMLEAIRAANEGSDD